MKEKFKSDPIRSLRENRTTSDVLEGDQHMVGRKVGSVLDELDFFATGNWLKFPVLGNPSWLLGAVRLSAFSDAKRWAIFIEFLQQAYSSCYMQGFNDFRYLYSNMTTNGHGLRPGEIIQVGRACQDSPEFEFREHEGSPIFALREGVKAVRVRGREIAVPKSLREYGEVGVSLDFPPDVQVQEFLQWLSAAHGPAVFEPDEALLGHLTEPLPLVLRLHEWYHPAIPARELPSQTETFQQIAEVLATGDPTKYKPTKPPNTDWRNWVI